MTDLEHPDALVIDSDAPEAEEAAPAPRRKRKSRATYSARTITECKRRGWIAGNVERRIPFPKPQGTTIDLFGVIDIIACDLSAPLGQRTIGIQATSGGTGGAVAPHRAKILAEPRARQWLEAGNRLELWSWAKQGRGKVKRWTLRVEVFTAESWSANQSSAYVPGDGPSEDRL